MIENEIEFLLKKFTVNVRGILHVGAYECEELDTYLKFTTIDRIIWIEAFPYLVELNLKKNPNLRIINAVVSEKDGGEEKFKITNNIKSSSILNLKYHKEIHPDVQVVDTVSYKTKTIRTVYADNKLNQTDFNFMTLDIQGAELRALKGMGEVLENIDALYVEVNEKELYEGCCTLKEIDVFLFDRGYDRKYLMLLNGYGNAFYLR